MRKRAETNLTTESLYHATWHIHITNQRTKQQENSEIIMLSVERKEKKKKKDWKMLCCYGNWNRKVEKHYIKQ